MPLSDEQIIGSLCFLDPRSRDIIALRYGLESDTCTLATIAKKYNITRERIRQIEEKTLRLLRHPSRAKYSTKQFTVMIESIIGEAGGLIQERTLVNTLLHVAEISTLRASGIINYVSAVHGRFEVVPGLNSWQLSSHDRKLPSNIISELVTILNNNNQEPLAWGTLYAQFCSTWVESVHSKPPSEAYILACANCAVANKLFMKFNNGTFSLKMMLSSEVLQVLDQQRATQIQSGEFDSNRELSTLCMDYGKNTEVPKHISFLKHLLSQVFKDHPNYSSLWFTAKLPQLEDRSLVHVLKRDYGIKRLGEEELNKFGLELKRGRDGVPFGVKFIESDHIASKTNIYLCEICGENFAINYRLGIHLYGIHLLDIKPLVRSTCPFCKKVFKRILLPIKTELKLRE